MLTFNSGTDHEVIPSLEHEPIPSEEKLTPVS
jgi:hypothetical protein